MVVGKTGASNDAPSSFTTKKKKFSKHGIEKFDLSNMDWIDNIQECPVYSPTKEEFEDPLTYLQHIAPMASSYGICKIIPPISASVPADVVLTKEKPKFKFTTVFQPLRLADWEEHDKVTFYENEKHYSFREFEKVAKKASLKKCTNYGYHPASYIEEKFWHNIAFGRTKWVEYGNNIKGSAFSTSPSDQLGSSKWNLKVFSQLPKSTLRLLRNTIPGITDPMLYIGMLFSYFAWHVEDHYLYSINYNHCGAAKTWYGVPGHAAPNFEELVREHVYSSEILTSEGLDATFHILFGKTTMFPPNILLKHNVPIYKAVQKPGEFIITFPRAYHSGFSQGFNCGEAVNFALGDWLPLGATCSWRYALLNILPFLPFEEILCKEAMLLYKCLAKFDSKTQSSVEDLPSRKGIKITFIHLIRFTHRALWQLMKLGPRVNWPDIPVAESCGICKCDCYVSYIKCNCKVGIMCLRHEKDIKTCPCGIDRTVYIRKDLSDFEAAAKEFEKETRILEMVESRLLPGYDSPLSDLFSCTEKGFYEPYCKI